MTAGSDIEPIWSLIDRAEDALERPSAKIDRVGEPGDARVALLTGLIDHAPLFPPASLPLEAALDEDRRAAADAAAFVLARFVCPASLLARLPDLGRGVSAVLDAPLDGVPVEAVETAALPDLGSLRCLAPEVYVEVPLDPDLGERLDAVAAAGLAAKVRCGGASVPSVEQLAAFVRGCRERGLAFKATAGLHHALPTGGQHGLVNLLAAAVFDDEESALADDDPGAFRLDAETFTWRHRHARAEELTRARRDRLRSIGSCSFFEPVGELRQIGFLGR